MLGGQRCEGGRLALSLGKGIVPVGDFVTSDGGFARQLFDADHAAQAWQSVNQAGKVVLAVEDLAAVAIAVDHNQSRRLNLAEAIKDGAHAEIR